MPNLSTIKIVFDAKEYRPEENENFRSEIDLREFSKLLQGLNRFVVIGAEISGNKITVIGQRDLGKQERPVLLMSGDYFG